MRHQKGYVMKIMGSYWKSEEDNVWVIDIPLLDASTQADSCEDIAVMASDLIESLSGDEDFKIQVIIHGDALLIEANDSKRLAAIILKRQRQKKRLRLEDIAYHLGAKSINDYAQYEQGKHMPSLEKFEQLLEAIDPELSPYLCLAKK